MIEPLAGAFPQFIVVAEVAVAMLLGGLIGYEREAANKPAGFRPHMMVSGACSVGRSGRVQCSRTFPVFIRA